MNATIDPFSDRRRWQWLALAAGVGVLVWLLGPVLTWLVGRLHPRTRRTAAAAVTPA